MGVLFCCSVFERLRAILHEGEIDKRVQFMIEGLFAVRKAGFETSGFPAVQAELDLIESEDQITHEVMLDAADLNAEMQLDVFKFDTDYEEHVKEYDNMKKEILGMRRKEEGHRQGWGQRLFYGFVVLKLARRCNEHSTEKALRTLDRVISAPENCIGT